MINPDILDYNDKQSDSDQEICAFLSKIIDLELKDSENKNLACASRLVFRRKSNRWLQQTEKGNPSHVLERKIF